MTAQHTQGKLMLWGSGDPSQVIAFESGPFMAQTIGGNDVPNARRLVACWNALADLPQEALDGGWTRAGLEAYGLRMEKQRDELLAALQNFVKEFEGCYADGEPAMIAARAAIQKATNKEQA